MEKTEVVDASAALPKPNGIVMNTGKEKKKKKSEFNTLQQLGKCLELWNFISNSILEIKSIIKY